MTTLLAVLLLLGAGQNPAAGTEDPRQTLARGIAQLQAIEVEAAVATLQGVGAPLRLEDLIRLHENLGVALAYADRPEEAQQAFERLLRIAPGHVLDYTISPKATFVFEKARQRMARQSAIAVDLQLPAETPYGTPLAFGLRCRANPGGLVQRWQLCHRLKGQGDDYRCVEAAAAEEALRLELPAVEPPADRAAGEALLQVALSGFDAAGNEVFRDPDRARPRELALGVELPGPWYASPWLWTAVGTATLAAGAGVVTAVWLLQPTTALLESEVR